MTSPFSRTTIAVVVGVALVSLGVAVALTVIGDDLGGGQPSAGADSYSVSAIGHRGLVDMLAKLDVPVVKSRSASGEKAKRGLLIVSEPTVSDDASKDRLRALVRSSARVLVVLPKWYGTAPAGGTWIDDANRLPTSEINAVLETLGFTPGIAVRARREQALWRAPELEMEPFGLVMPVAQLAAAFEGEDVMVGNEDGALVIQRLDEDRWIRVLTDPDVLNNHGLRHPENAVFAINLIDHLREGGPVVLDEVIHGYAQPPSLLRTLFRFPLVLATLQVLICALLAVWAAMIRFGPRRAAPPPIAPGKDFLIQNTAALLHYGGHHGDALRRYLAQSIAAVRHALHAPALGPDAMRSWLESVRKTRGGSISLLDLERDVLTASTELGPQRTVELADRVYRWRMEMINGSRHRT